MYMLERIVSITREDLWEAFAGLIYTLTEKAGLGDIGIIWDPEEDSDKTRAQGRFFNLPSDVHILRAMAKDLWDYCDDNDCHNRHTRQAIQSLSIIEVTAGTLDDNQKIETEYETYLTDEREQAQAEAEAKRRPVTGSGPGR